MDKCLAFVVLLVLAFASPARAVDCRTTTYSKVRYTTCRVDAAHETLRLFDRTSGARTRGFASLEKSLAREQRHLVFAMNAGMFHPGFGPVGLLVIDGREIAPINRAAGTGNFFLQPNGVFLIDRTGPRVLSTDEYRNLAPALATQSGPMLLHHGRIPDIAAFRSNSRHVRNGVCVPKGSTVAFSISESEVTFREFAEYFRSLGCKEALYLDGSISSLHSRQLGRSDARAVLGPIVAIVE